MFRAPENSQSMFVAARFAADRKGLSPFGRSSSPSLAQVVRQVRASDHRLELHPNGLVAYARDLEIGSSISFTGSASITRQELAGHSS